MLRIKERPGERGAPPGLQGGDDATLCGVVLLRQQCDVKEGSLRSSRELIVKNGLEVRMKGVCASCEVGFGKVTRLRYIQVW